ncbi:hypothetical protein [Oceanospirillum sanctuarii]|nr:hypothetical protein [Oceanospirillum sanctuarii]
MWWGSGSRSDVMGSHAERGSQNIAIVSFPYPTRSHALRGNVG